MIGLLLAVALAQPPEAATIQDLTKLSSRPWNHKQRAQIELALTADDPERRAIAAALLYAEEPERWNDALIVELSVRNEAARREGRIEMLAPADVQQVSSSAAASLSQGIPSWVGSCMAFVAWRDRAAYVQTAAETIDVVRLYRRGCVDGAWRRSIDAGKISAVAVLDKLDRLAREAALAPPAPAPAP